MLSAISFSLDQSKILSFGNGLSIHKICYVKFLDLSRHKEFADDNFENYGKFS